MNLSSVIGQEKAVLHLKNLFSSQRVPPGLLFYGPQGVGKSLAAKEFAKALNCLNPKARAEFEPCNTCPNCVETEKKIHPDVVFAGLQMQAYLRDEPLEKQQHIRIDTIREICNKTQQKAVRDGWKIFIIDQAELLLKEAANALLKFLEEPMGRALWILATSKKEAMLPTIISRCQSVEFCPLSQAAAAKILIGQGVDFAQAQMLAEAGQGSVSRAILVQELSQTLAGLDNKDAMYPFNASKKLSKDLAQARRQAKLFLDMMEVSAHKKWRAKPDKNIFSNAIKKMEMYKKYINQNVSPQLVLQTAIIEFEKLRLTESE